MTDDESWVFIVSIVIALAIWLWWIYRVLRYPPLISPWSNRLPLLITPIINALALYFVLAAYASPDVRTSGTYMVFYLVLGAAWLGIAALFIRYFGIAIQEDVVERRNNAAVPPIVGALVGIAACYGGGNIGSGPGWWVVVISAGLATVGFFAAWFALEALTQISYTITVERDASAGLRLAGYLIAIGIFLGRAVAGDWVSLDATISDFIVYCGPVIIILIFAVIVEYIARPTVRRPVPSPTIFGLTPALVYMGMAVLIVAPQLAAMTH